MSRSLIACFAGLAWAMSLGCSGEGPGDSGPCLADDDCTPGLVCQAGTCGTPTTTNPIPFALHIDPPGQRATLVAQQVGELLVVPGSTLPDFAMVEPTVVSGFVQSGGGLQPGPRVTADLRFRQTSCLPGRCAVWDQRTNQDGDFSVRLSPGVYTITVTSDQADVPTRRFQDIVVEPDTLFLSPFIMPNPDTSLPVRGRVVRSDACDSMRVVPVVGAEVVAEAIDGRFQSTTAQTDEDGGFFLILPSDADQVEFRVNQGAASDLVIPSAGYRTEPVPEDVSDWAPTLTLGAYADPVPVQIAVPVTPQTEFAPAVVTLRQEVVDPGEVPNGVTPRSLRFERTVMAQSGIASFELIPGTYQVVAAHPSNYGYAIAIDEIEVLAPECGSAPVLQAFAAPAIREAPPLEGVVVDPNGAPVPGVTVYAQLTEASGVPASDFAVSAQFVSASATTDSSGRFALPSQQGTYVISAWPPDAVAWSRALLEVQSSDLAGELRIPLPVAQTVRGRIVDPDGDPVGGAVIEGYARTDAGYIILDDSVTDEDGAYALRVPLRLPPFLDGDPSAW